eukprot:gene13921-15369_t
MLHNQVKSMLETLKTGNVTGKELYRIFTEEDGTIYEGEFKKGRRCGFGRSQSIDGSFYVGEWKYDKYHGKGKMTYKSGYIYEGEFRDGKKHGKGTLILPDGQTISMEYEYDQKMF